MSDNLKSGDVCAFKKSTGTWGYFWILEIEKWDKMPERIFHVIKFNTETSDELHTLENEDLEHLKQNKSGHRPIIESRIKEVNPKTLRNIKIQNEDLKGYNIWRESF